MLLAQSKRWTGEMFHIVLFGIGADGKPLGPESAIYPGDDIEGAIARAKLIMQTVTFRFGRPRSFKIYDNNAVLVHDLGAADGSSA
jgi:hypothetical protein